MAITVREKEQLFDRSFWRSPKKWPHDPPEYVFLARAFNEIGRAIHGNQWKEPEYPEEPENDGDENAWQAYERAEKEFEQLEIELANMKAKIAHFIREQCEKRNLVTAARVAQGEMRDLEWYRWNIDDLRTMFFRCEVCLDAQRGWIFVTRNSLNGVLATQPYAESLPMKPHLSPYLRLMLSVSAAMGVTPENQPEKKIVEHELEKRWSSGTLSKKLRGAMATLIREPESQRGRAGKKQK